MNVFVRVLYFCSTVRFVGFVCLLFAVKIFEFLVGTG